MAAASGRGQQVRCQYHPDAHLAEDYRAGDMICTECGLVVGDRVIDVGRSARIVDSQFILFQWMENVQQRQWLKRSLPSWWRRKPISLKFRFGLEHDDSRTDKWSRNCIFKPEPPQKTHERGGSSVECGLSRDWVWIRDWSKHSLFTEHSSAMADRMNFPGSLVDRAKVNFKEAYESRQLKGRSNDAIAAACLYIACRQEGVPRTFKVKIFPKFQILR